MKRGILTYSLLACCCIFFVCVGELHVKAFDDLDAVHYKHSVVMCYRTIAGPLSGPERDLEAKSTHTYAPSQGWIASDKYFSGYIMMKRVWGNVSGSGDNQTRYCIEYFKTTKREINLKFVDDTGKEISSPEQISQVVSGDDLSCSYTVKHRLIPGYVFSNVEGVPKKGTLLLNKSSEIINIIFHYLDEKKLLHVSFPSQLNFFVDKHGKVCSSDFKVSNLSDYKLKMSFNNVKDVTVSHDGGCRLVSNLNNGKAAKVLKLVFDGNCLLGDSGWGPETSELRFIPAHDSFVSRLSGCYFGEHDATQHLNIQLKLNFDIEEGK